MAGAWKTVRVFISSTFLDMHQERDYLVRIVFPKLQEELQAHRVRLVAVDLRWGVSEEDVENQRTLDICLDEIDTCRPYFLGLLAHRYGTLLPEAKESLTALEIHHAVLHGYTPRQLTEPQLLLDEDQPGARLSPAEKELLLRAYARDLARNKFRLRPDLSPDDIAALRAVFQRLSLYQRHLSFFFFRAAPLTRQLAWRRWWRALFQPFSLRALAVALAGPRPPAFFERESPEKLARLKTEITQAGIEHQEYRSIGELGRLVSDKLKDRITAGLAAERPADWLQQENESHELFLAQRTHHFVGRRALLDRLHDFCQRDSPPALLRVAAEPGCGKSALLARFAFEAAQRHPDWLVIPHFVGASPNSTNLPQVLRRFCALLNRDLEGGASVPSGLPDLLPVLPRLLAQAAARKRVLVLLDAVNQFDPWDHARSLHWLPKTLPPHVRWLVSDLRESPDQSLPPLPLPAEEIVLGGLSAGETEAFVHDYLKEIRHEFPTPQIKAAFLRKVGAGHPLYIRLALEELRVFGDYERLGERIEAFPSDVIGLFSQVIERISENYEDQPELVPDFLSLLACLRQGMSAEVLQTLLKHHAPKGHAKLKLPDLVWFQLYRDFGPYLFERDELIDFFHGQLRLAVERHCLRRPAARQAAHQRIADFCARWEPAADHAKRYALRYRTYHLVQAGNWRALAQALQDGPYLEAARQMGCTPAVVLAEAIRDPQGQLNPTATQRLRTVLYRLLEAKIEAPRKVALETAKELEWLDVLIRGAESRSEETRMWACHSLFAIYRHRLDQGDEAGAWEGVRRLRARLRRRPRNRTAAALAGLLVSIFLECAENPQQLPLLLRQASDSVWAVLPFGWCRAGWVRHWTRRLGHFAIDAFRPGVTLALKALEHSGSAINLDTARQYFLQPPAEKEILRGYFPYLEPVARDLGALTDLVQRFCTVRDPFHYNLIMGCLVVQGVVQPEPVMDLCRQMAERDDSLALYEATRSLYYLLDHRRETGTPPRPEHDDLLCQWLRRYYARTDYVVDFGRARLRGRSLGEYVGDYLAKHRLPQGRLFDDLIAGALERRQDQLQADLFDALGIVGQHGGRAFALDRYQPVMPRYRQLNPLVQDALKEALARIYFHWPQEVSDWLAGLPGAGLTIAEVAQYPVPPSGVWRGGGGQILRRVLLSEPSLRTVLLHLLNGLPRADSLTSYIQFVAHALLDLLFGERPPAPGR